MDKALIEIFPSSEYLHHDEILINSKLFYF